MAMAERRAQSATKMASDILHGTFSFTYLSTHTIAGGNNDKAALHPDIVQGVIGIHDHTVIILYLRPSVQERHNSIYVVLA